MTDQMHYSAAAMAAVRAVGKFLFGPHQARHAVSRRHRSTPKVPSKLYHHMAPWSDDVVSAVRDRELRLAENRVTRWFRNHGLPTRRNRPPRHIVEKSRRLGLSEANIRAMVDSS